MSDHTPTLLIVEDDDVDVEVVVRGLKRRELNFNVQTAQDGVAGLDKLRTGLSVDQKNNLIVLLDLNMPRMTGHEFLSELRSDPNLKRAIVFVLTTSSLKLDRLKAYTRNVAGYFVKSNIDELLNVLEHYAQCVEFPHLDDEAR